MTKLAKYLSETGMTQKAFADAVRVKQPYVSRLVNGTGTPTICVAKRIQDATGGAVKYDDWVKATE